MSTTAPTVNESAHVTVPASTLALLCTCFAVSGIAALIYQTAWTRQFALVFGTSELAVATVLAAYMGGLALGAALIERLLPRITRPVTTYALLEIGIAMSAVFLVPLLLQLSAGAQVAMFGGQSAPPASEGGSLTLFYMASAFVALALPTTLMGATLPLLVRYSVSEQSQLARRIGLLYSFNTLGAVCGALLTAFFLLPQFGLHGTVWSAAALNGVVFLLALALSRKLQVSTATSGYSLDPKLTQPAQPRRGPFKLTGPTMVLPLMLLAGAVAFFQEVLWTRMIAHVVGSSIYAFGVMVASFLTGIALGGALGGALGKSRATAALSLAIALLVAAAAAAAAYLLLDTLLPATAGLLENRVQLGPISLPMNALFAGLLLLPMTLAIGTTYPLAVRVLASAAAEAGTASARVYAWNTVGAIAGSLAAGFVLIPALRYEGALQCAVLMSAALGVLALWIMVPTPRIAAISLSVLAVAGAVLFRPQSPDKLLITSPLNVGAQGERLYYGIGRSASVVVLAQDGGFALRTNGLPEALMDGPGSTPRFSGEYWLSPLAVLARPDTRDMLIVGFGGGVVVEGVPPSVEHIDVIELEPKVIDANQAIGALRKRDPLADPRVKVILNDARGALALTTRRYDAIVSQPSHPWTAGASHLYTREFMQLARSHLNQDGVFVQWMNVIFMDENLLRSLTATLLSVFEEVRVYRPDPNTLVFLASDAPLDPETHLALTGLPLRFSPLHYARFGINCAEDMVSALVLDAEGARELARSAPLITDDDNRIATSSVFEKGRGMTADTSGRVLAAHDPLQRPNSFIYTALKGRLSFPYIIRRNAVFVALDPSLIDRVGRIGIALGDGEAGMYARATVARLRQQPQRASELLRLGLEEFPQGESLRYEFLRSSLSDLAVNRATDDVNEQAAMLSESGAAVLAAIRHSASGDWSGVANADAQLAAVEWTDPWFMDATELRANWRSRVNNAAHRRRFADESIALVDRINVTTPNIALFGLRARAGQAAERPDIVIESVWSYARQEVAATRILGSSSEALNKDIKVLLAMLDEAARLKDVNTARLAEVRAGIGALQVP